MSEPRCADGHDDTPDACGLERGLQVLGSGIRALLVPTLVRRGAGAYARRLVIPDEYGLLEQIVVENEIALVCFDPINSFITTKIDAHRDVEIRRVLDPLAALAARHGFAAFGVVHLNRRTDSDILNRITGSGGYGGSARSILTFGRHPENENQRVVAAEGNWQREAHSDLFELRENVVFADAAPEDQTQPALVHVGTVDLDSSDLIDQLADDRTVLEQAKDYLLGELVGGPVAVTDLRRGAEANGVSWPTIERAKSFSASRRAAFPRRTRRAARAAGSGTSRSSRTSQKRLASAQARRGAAPADGGSQRPPVGWLALYGGRCHLRRLPTKISKQPVKASGSTKV
jgi:hypothetical protein